MMYNLTKINQNSGVNNMLEFGTENEEINQYSRLAPFVISIKDDPDNQLSIVIALPVDLSGCSLDHTAYENDNPKIRELLSNAVQGVADVNRMYEIKFKNYIIYQCRNESYTAYDSYELIKGKHLVILERSSFLNYYKDVIFDKDYDNEKKDRKHYRIFAENHIIDVISNDPPTITSLNSNLP